MKTLRKALPEFLRGKGAGQGFSLARLYAEWPRVVGEDLAAMAQPIGHRKRSLILGVHDSVTMQELSFYAPHLLERIAAHLGENHFDNIKFELLKGRIPLDTVRLEEDRPAPYRRKPGPLGRLMDTFDPDSPVARCYRAFVTTVKQDNSETR